MRTTQRDYGDEAGDFRRLAGRLTDDPGHVRDHTTWCLGRLADWRHGLWGDKASTPRFCERNAHLWFDALGDLVAAAAADVERICTHSAFRRRGLARTAIHECVR